MPPYMYFMCYNTHDKWHVTITDVREDSSCKPPFHGLGKSSLLFRGVEKKHRVSTSCSPAEQLLHCAQFPSQQTDTHLSWDSWVPVLVCLAGVLCHSFFPKVPPSFCKGRECDMSPTSLWAPFREKDPLRRHQKTALTRAGRVTPFHWVLWEERGNQRAAPSQDATVRTRHTPVQKLASYVAAGAWWTMGSCFSMVSVDEETRKFLVCTEN